MGQLPQAVYGMQHNNVSDSSPFGAPSGSGQYATMQNRGVTTGPGSHPIDENEELLRLLQQAQQQQPPRYDHRYYSAPVMGHAQSLHQQIPRQSNEGFRTPLDAELEEYFMQQTQ